MRRSSLTPRVRLPAGCVIFPVATITVQHERGVIFFEVKYAYQSANTLNIHFHELRKNSNLNSDEKKFI